MRCPFCETENPHAAKYCMQCAQRLVDSTDAPRPAERRQITVVFCDLVGSTALSEELDPEDLRDVIRQYHAACGTVVARYGGSIAQHLGDGLLVYFGHPDAHEDDARRAVRAGLEIQKVVSRLTARGRPLAVRIGIHTGVVVVGAVGAEGHQLALGATPNLAARIQQEAEPGTVFISEGSYRLVRGFFHFEDLGCRKLRGIAQPVHLYRVDRETGARSRMEAIGPTGLTPFIGREKELALLMRRWHDAMDGKAPVVALSGEAGIGKSRLVRTLRESLSADALLVEGYASPLFHGTAFHPMVEMFERQLGLANGTTEDGRSKLRAELDLVSVATPEVIGPLEALLSIAPLGDGSTGLVPQRQRQATFDSLILWLHALAERRPVLFVLEDLHWADPSTIELVRLLIERSSKGRMMLVFTYRPAQAPGDFVFGFKSPRVDEVNLLRMSREETQQMLAAVASDKSLPESVEREVLARADGVPLYVEEIGRAVVENRAARLRDDTSQPDSKPVLAVPATLDASLKARLDRLGAKTRRVAELAATVGRTFSLNVLLDVAGMEEKMLRAEIDRLEASGVVIREGAPSDETYIFKHALLRDAAYDSLVRDVRQGYHRQIARALTDRFPNISGSQPELLAHHFADADMPAEAITHWAVAGQRAITRAANDEAIKAFGAALGLISGLPGSEERDRQQIELRCGLGLAHIYAKGWSAPEIEATYGPAFDLSQRYGDVPLRVLYGIWAYYIVRSDRDRTTQLAPRFGDFIKRSTDRLDLLVAHSMLSGYGFWGADYSTALQYSASAASFVDRENPRKQALDLFSQGYDGQLYPFIFRAWTDVIQGRAKSAMAVNRESVDIGLASGHPYLIAYSLSCAAAVSHDMRDIDLLETRAKRLSELAAENSFLFLSMNATSFLGYVACTRGQHERGLEMMHQAVGFYRAVGANMLLAYYLSWLAEGYIGAQRLDEGLAAVNEGLKVTATTQSIFCEPELHRLKGEILILQGDAAEGERCLHTARATAVDKGATLFEMRASLSLGRIRAARGQGTEAVSMLRASLGGIASDEPLRERQEIIDLGKQLGHSLE
jgi:class 3 adenylate cyclase